MFLLHIARRDPFAVVPFAGYQGEECSESELSRAWPSKNTGKEVVEEWWEGQSTRQPWISEFSPMTHTWVCIWPARTGDVTTCDRNGATTDGRWDLLPHRSKRTWACVRAGYLLPLAAEHVTWNFSPVRSFGCELATCRKRTRPAGSGSRKGFRIGCLCAIERGSYFDAPYGEESSDSTG
jgi:hypothetical protein